MNGRTRHFLSIGFCTLVVGCATYQSQVAPARENLRSGQPQAAIDFLRPLAEQESKDRLVHLLDFAMALKIAGQHNEAQQVFIKADRLADQLDYISVSEVATAALSSEEQLTYKGEFYEKLMINAMSALSFIATGQLDSATVEARRINEKVQRIRQSAREDYEENSFAHYLSALLWEANRNYDSAYIEYERAFNLDPTIDGIQEDLVRIAKLARRNDAYKKWKDSFPAVVEDPSWYDRSLADLVVIVEQGWGPRKDFSPQNRRFPALYSVFSNTRSAKVSIQPSPVSKQTRVVYNVTQAALDSYNKDMSWMMTRKLGAFAAKEIVADQIRQKDEALGAVAWIVMHATDRADLRHWSTLPETVQIARFRLTPGEYQVVAQGLSSSGTSTDEATDFPLIRLKPRQFQFLNWRTLR